MRMRVALSSVLALCVLGVAVPSGAQGVGRSCDISGTWYGGSDPSTPYQLTVTPIGAGRYSVVAQQAIDIRLFGGAMQTNWSGEIRKNGRTYDWYAMLYWVVTPPDQTTPPAPLPEVDIVHSRLRFVDCNTLKNTIDTYGAYFAFNPPYIDAEGNAVPGRTPFVDPVDFDIMAAIGIPEFDEMYYRLPIGRIPPPAPAAVR